MMVALNREGQNVNNPRNGARRRDFLGCVGGFFAQQPAKTAGVKLPVCSQSMITGTTWQAVFPQPNAPRAMRLPAL